MKRRNFLIFGAASFAASALAKPLSQTNYCASTWYLPTFVADTPNNITLKVRDTDSALGRYNDTDCTKTISLEDVVKLHGHLCDGLVFSYLQIAVALQKLFPDGIIDRTDLRGACKNSPCMVDTLAYLTGARINFKTLRIDSTLGASHIIQRISTNEAYQVKLAAGYFPKDLAKLESQIRSKVAKGEDVTPQEIDRVEQLANSFIKVMLTTPLDRLVSVKKLASYTFEPVQSVDVFGKRGDVVNKHISKSK
ncbi:MAG: formylmethanofuran dehydrogenase subunit E family protein [Sulfurimonas sp.]|jgi:formylmethanofuran dehydrogenase subunit E|nr:formylmethanofuran dehydrogenase subunit E family protein [Sulfurimonas sp.]